MGYHRTDTKIAFRFTSSVGSADVVEGLLANSPGVTEATLTRYAGGRGTALLSVHYAEGVGEHNTIVFLGKLLPVERVLGYRHDGNVERLEGAARIIEGEESCLPPES